MSPSELMIRTIHWVCPCCGEVARTARPPRDCVICGRTGSEFEKQRERLRKFGIKYLIVEDPIDQYLLELYTALEYKTSLTEFDNH